MIIHLLDYHRKTAIVLSFMGLEKKKCYLSWKKDDQSLSAGPTERTLSVANPRYFGHERGSIPYACEFVQRYINREDFGH